MAFRDAGQYLFRLQALLRQYLNAEVDVIDAAALTITGVTEDNFETPSVADADIQVFCDERQQFEISVVLIPMGRSVREFNKTGLGGQARRDHDIKFETRVRAKGHDGADGQHGAWLRACRVMDACQAVYMKHPKGNIQDGPNAVDDDLFSEMTPGDIVRLPEQDESDAFCVTLSMDGSFRALEVA